MDPEDISEFLLPPVQSGRARPITKAGVDSLKAAAEKTVTADINRRGSPLFYRVQAALAL
ncbi:hypothetical protein AQS8620_03188 [Aquimixticola soesokkakensis]|uniref:Uncharacterized protein n=1 Tax=Aquimixticola soesokkakensis TaxID=1519096 RepID=A0A1Y5TMZ7_9RHOB|nr:hypothetical protein AQS8620_03188 [Aquimixticola soesokkakensis]